MALDRALSTPARDLIVWRISLVVGQPALPRPIDRAADTLRPGGSEAPQARRRTQEDGQTESPSATSVPCERSRRAVSARRRAWRYGRNWSAPARDGGHSVAFSPGWLDDPERRTTAWGRENHPVLFYLSGGSPTSGAGWFGRTISTNCRTRAIEGFSLRCFEPAQATSGISAYANSSAL